MTASGKTIGKALGDGIAGGVEQAKGKVEQASDKVAAALKKIEDQAGKTKVAEAQLQALRDKGITDAGKLAAAEEKVAAAKRNETTATEAHTKATDTLKRSQDNLAKAEKDAGDAAEKSAQKQSLITKVAGDAGKALDGLAGKAKNFGTTIVAGLGFGAGLGIAGVTKSLLDMGDTFANVNKTLANSTGASGQALDGLEKSVENIGKNSPKSLGDIATAIGDVAKTTKLTGDPLETLTKQMIKLDTIGSSVDIGSVTQAMRAFNVPADQMSGQLDQIWRISRGAGVPISDLVSTLQSGAPQLQQFGLNAAQSANLLGGLKLTGLDSEKAMGALSKALNALSKDGGDLKANFTKATAEIKQLADSGQQAEAITKASKLFGAKADLPMIKAIQEGKLSLDDMNSSLAEGQKGILDSGLAVPTMSSAWNVFKNNVMILLKPIITEVFGAMTKGITWFKDHGVVIIREFGDVLKGMWNSEGVQSFVTKVVGLFDEWWPKIAETAKTVGSAIIDIGKVAGPILVTALGAVVTAIGKVVSVGVGIVKFFKDNKEFAAALGVVLATTVGPALVTAATGFALATARTVAFGIAQKATAIATEAWTAAQWLLNAAMDANPIGLIVAAIAAFVAGIIHAYNHSETFRKIVQAAWEGIKVAVAAVVDWFTNTVWPALKKAWEAIGDGWNWLVKTAEDVWNGIKEKFTKIVDFVTSLPDKITAGAKGMWEGLKGGLHEVLQWIADKWNALSDLLSFDMPDIPGVPGRGQHITVLPHIVPQFDTGGYTGDLPTKAIAGVVHGGEHVIRASSTKLINNAYPGLLDYMNGNGKLPGFEGGGLVPGDKLVSFAKGVEGKPYDWGGVNWGDCSGAVSAIANFATGLPPFGSRFATGSEGAELAKRGFKTGSGPAGSLNVGWFNGGPYGGHTAATLPDGTHFEMGGNRGNGQFGGAAAGASDHQFTDHAYLPLAATQLDKGAPTVGSAAVASAGASKTPADATGSGGSSGGSAVSLPTSITGLSTSWVDSISAGHTSSPGHRDPLAPEYFPKAITAAVGGQVSSLLGVAGIPDSPGWLQGISQAVGQISFGKRAGASVGDETHRGTGAAPGPDAEHTYDTGGWLQDGTTLVHNKTGGPEPVLSTNQWNTAESGMKVAMTMAKGFGGAGRAAKPAGGVTYNIQARDTEDAFIRAQRQERERAAAKLSRF